MNQGLKLVVRPRWVNWHQAKETARLNGGRLLTYREVLRWANAEPLELDIWIDRMEHDRAQCFDASKQDVRFKLPEERALLVMLVDPIQQRKIIETQQLKAAEREAQYKRLRKQRMYRPSKFNPFQNH